MPKRKKVSGKHVSLCSSEANLYMRSSMVAVYKLFLHHSERSKWMFKCKSLPLNSDG